MKLSYKNTYRESFNIKSIAYTDWSPLLEPFLFKGAMYNIIYHGYDRYFLRFTNGINGTWVFENELKGLEVYETLL